MGEEVTPQQEQSTILSDVEVQALTGEGEGEQDVTLPSDVEQFEMPEKFAGKSAEEIAKAYLELEKLKAKQAGEQEGGDSESTKPDEATKEEDPKDEKAPTPIEEAKVKEYEKYFSEKGTLSDEMYQELADAGYTKEQVDREIEFRQYQQQKAVKDILEPLGGGLDKFYEVVEWAQANKSPEEIAEFNEALKSSSKLGQQALLKSLYAEAASGGEVTIHSNAPQKLPAKGYANETDFFNDMNNPAYKTDPKYQQKVMEKLGASDTTGWSF